MKLTFSANEIDTWAKEEPRRAQELLPELIVRLVLATSKNVIDYNFPIEKGIQFSGYDGFLTSKEQTAYFPEGKSVWEFGTNVNAIDKFKEDIKKRSNDPLGVDIANTVFIFSTLKVWNHRTSIEELINESKTCYSWKDIRIIDGSKIALWLEQCPTVSVWFAEMVGKAVQGIRTMKAYWEEYCLTTSPRLGEDYFLIGRDTEVQNLSEWDFEKPECRVVIGESSLEATLFIISAMFRIHQHDNNILNRILIVESSDAWHILKERQDKTAVLVPVFHFTEEIQWPRKSMVILPISKFSPLSKLTKNLICVELPCRSKTNYYKALESMGYEMDDCARIEEETKRRFLPLYKSITTVPTRKQPRWLDVGDRRELIPALLIGGWNARFPGDRDVVEKISGITYEEYEQNFTRWTTIEDAPVFRVLNVCQIISVQDLWNLLFDQLTKGDIDRFQQCAADVFGTVDPTFELPEEQWAFASVHGKESEYSEMLRQGLVISLIMLSEQDGVENNCNIVSTKRFVDGIVRDLLHPVITWQHWNTIAPSLMLLAEASPEAVLEKIEHDITDDNGELWKLFAPSKDILMGRNYYTHILWSLESLVWYRNCAVRAIMLLVKINERKIEYTLVNSPMNTLYETFCLWHPQSCLGKTERLDVLKRIFAVYPATGWELADKLLPSGGGTCGNIHRPRWRSFDEETPRNITNQEFYEGIREVTAICMEQAAAVVGQWEIMIKHISLFMDHYDELAERLTVHCRAMSEDEVWQIADALREKICRFRQFPDADWSWDEEDVQRLEDLLWRIMPNGVERYRYLFKLDTHSLHPTPYHDGKSYSYQEEQEKLRAERVEAVEAILSEFGSETLIKFSMEAENTGDLGQILADMVLKNSYDFDLLLSIKAKNYTLYTSILCSLYRTHGLEKLLCAMNDSRQLTDEDKGDILCHTPLSPDVWDAVDGIAEITAQYYWEHVGAFRLGDKYISYQDYFIDQLLKHERPFSAVQLIAYTEYHNTDQIMRILRDCARLQEHREKNGLTLSSISQHNILDLFKKLYADQSIETEQLAGLEFMFFKFFKHTTVPKGLTKYFQDHPTEYVAAISQVYKDDLDTPQKKTELSQTQFGHYFDIIESFTAIPGCNSEIVSEEVFRAWINTAQAYADAVNYKRAFGICLGRLLSYAPRGDDGVFPHEIVRNYFEENQNSVVIDHFVMGKLNQRGFYYATAGMEEKKLAKEYRSAAEKLWILYPQTASILGKLADHYEQEALYEQKSEMMDFRG